MTTIRIGIAQSTTGMVRVAGPDDIDPGQHTSAMDAAWSLLLEDGETPANRYWIELELPDPWPEVSALPGVQAKLKAASA